MLRRELLQLVALGLLMTGTVPVAAALASELARTVAARDFARLRLDCNADRITSRMTASSLPYFVGCRYDAVRSVLPAFTTVDWEPSDKAPLGVITAQSAPPELNLDRLRREFTITVSTGPPMSIGNEIAVEGEVLAFQMAGRPRPPPDSPFEVHYLLSTDPAGRVAAVESRDYAAVVDRDFRGGGVLEVTTLEGGRSERLHLFVLLRYPPDGASSGAIMAHAEGRILRRPRVSLFDAIAREGDDLRFLAMIDRGGIARGAFTYEVSIEPDDAVAGRDFDPPDELTLTFEPGESAKYLTIPTLDHAEGSEDVQLHLLAGIPGEPMVRARGTILNSTAVSTSSGESTDEPSDGDILADFGLDWLAALGAAAIGLLAGFGFGTRKPKPGAVKDGPADKAESPAPPAAMPVVGWTTETPETPKVTGGSLAPDGPSITIDVTTEIGPAGAWKAFPSCRSPHPMADIDLQLEEPLIDPETLEAAIDKCQDAIVHAESGELPRFSWPLLRSSVADAVSQSAKTDKVHWLFQGWAFARELKSYKDPEQYPPERVAVLKLGEHELSGTFHPIVTISCEGAVIARLRFDIDLKGRFNAVSISIQGGKITACGGGECELTMELKFRDIDLTGPITLKKLRLPGKLEFRNPITIPLTECGTCEGRSAR